MERFVSYEKMSKKQQKIVNASKRGNWGNVKPITKVKASAKIYNRKKKQNSGDYGYSFGSSAFFIRWGNAMSKSLNEWGRFLALVLRHKPQAVGIELDAHGWAQVEALLTAFNRIEVFNMLMLEQIVTEDSKQRFAFSEDKKRIRANQGHSVKVDVELREVVPPELLYHGTGVKYVASINRQGLIAKQRLYVHLSANVETAHNVGKRHGEPFIYKVMAGEMARAGYKFYLSANGVWLTECVPRKFLRE